MAKGHRSSNARSIRLFEVSNQFTLVEMGDHAFDNEDQMHRLIEDNIQALFPGLSFLTREFREMAGGELRPDTVAFDTNLNTFVALEYKNRRNTEAVDQARTYLNFMGEHKADLVLLYTGKKGSSRSKDSFDWKSMYAIIMAPEFGDYQILGADKDSAVELYKIRMYINQVIVVERVGGGHERTPTTTLSPKPSPKPLQTTTIKPHSSSHNTSKQATLPKLNDIDGDVRLASIKYVKKMNHPLKLTPPDGSRITIESWTDILASISDWLVSKGHLGKLDCPVPIGRNNAILNTQPIHQNGRRFRRYKKAGQLYVFLNVGPMSSIRHSIKLIKVARLNPSDFKVSFDEGRKGSGLDKELDTVTKVRPKYTPLKHDQISGNTISLLNLNVSDHADLIPATLLLPSGEIDDKISSWRAVMRSVAHWLFDNNHIKDAASGRPLWSHIPRQPNGRSYSHEQLSAKLFVYLNYNNKDMLMHIQKLLENINYKPHEFKIVFK